jgi:transformation/transcription domain-associated protein
MIDTVRDSELARVLPHMIPALIETLRNGEVAYHKDSLDYQFRRLLINFLHHIPCVDVLRPQALTLLGGFFYLLRHDNEENGVVCCKAIIDLVRSFRALNEELITEFTSILQDVLRNTKGLVDELLSENSPKTDPEIVLPSTRSFKVLAEMGMVIVTFFQCHRTLVTPAIQTIFPLTFGVLALESPAQKKAREDFEAMGGFWSGMAPVIKNTIAYTDFITAQIKVTLPTLPTFPKANRTYLLSRWSRPWLSLSGASENPPNRTVII